MTLKQILKTVEEVKAFTIDFADTDTWISGATISTATLRVYDIAKNILDNSLLVSTTGSVSNGIVTGKLTGGTAGKFYKVVVSTIWSNGETINDSIEVMIDV